MAALLNPKFWIAVAIVAALAFSHFFVYRSGKAEVRKDFDAYKLSQQELRILADRASAHRAAARQTAVNKESRDGQERIAAVETELAGARADGERMRRAYRAAAERARALSRVATAGPSEPDSDPIGVLAVLLGRADSREEIVRGYADRLQVAGSICERGWDAGLRATHGPAAP